MLGRIAIVALLVMATAIGLCVSTTSAADSKIALMWVGNVGKDATADAGGLRVAPDKMSRNVAVGFLRRLRELAPDMHVTTKKDLPDYATAEKLFREFESSMDAIVFLRSAAAQWMAKANPKVPCFVGGANNPKLLGVVQSLEAPDGMITGVTYYLPAELRFGVIKEMFPTTKSVGILFQEGHPTVAIERMETQEQCRRLGWNYSERTGDSAESLVQKTKELVQEVDLIILSNCGLVMDNTASIVAVTNPAKKPVFSYAQAPVKNGAVAGLVARDEYLGELLAESVVDVVLNGKPISKVPVRTDDNPQIFFNHSIIESLGLSLPTALMQRAAMIK